MPAAANLAIIPILGPPVGRLASCVSLGLSGSGRRTGCRRRSVKEDNLVKMATRGLFASLAILVALAPPPALGQWVGQMDEAYGVRQTSFSSVPTTAGAAMPIEPVPETGLLQPGAALPAAGPMPVFRPGLPRTPPARDGDGYCCPPNGAWTKECAF